MRGAGLGTAFGQERPTVKRVSSRSTIKVSGPLLSGPLDRPVRHYPVVCLMSLQAEVGHFGPPAKMIPRPLNQFP